MHHFKASDVALSTSFHIVAIENAAWEVLANVTEVTSKATSTHFVLGSGPITRVESVSGIKSVVMAVKQSLLYAVRWMTINEPYFRPQ